MVIIPYSNHAILQFIADMLCGQSHSDGGREGLYMVAALGLGIIGVILLVVLVLAAILFFLRRA
jgi:hypothetical protein